MDILNNPFITYDCIRASVNATEKEKQEFNVEYGDILFQRSSETLEDVGHANVYLDSRTALFGGFTIRGKKKGVYNPLFFKYLLDSPTARKKVIVKGAGAQHFNIGQEGLSKVVLSFPSIQEQNRIAVFMNLLDQRIAIQNKVIEQYQSLIRAITHTFFNSKSDYPRVPLSDLSPNIASGKSKLALGPFPLYGSTGIIGTCTSGIYKGEMILVARVGSIGQIQLINTGGCGITDNTLIVNSGELNHYVYFYLKSFDFQKITSGTTQPLITGSSLKAINVPVLPFQERDSFIKLLAAIEQRITLEQTILQQYLKTKSFFLTSLFV